MIESYGTLCIIVEKDGKRSIKIFDRKGFDRALFQFAVGEELDLEIRTIERKRTSAQNRFFYGPVLDAFQRLGYRKQEAHDLVCLLLIPQDLKLPDGSIMRVPGHTSQLNVKEFNELIDAAISLAAEQGEVVQDGIAWRAEQAELARKSPEARRRASDATADAEKHIAGKV